METVTFRPAKRSECLTIARLYSISSDGVADYIWTKIAEPGENIFEVGEKRYRQEGTAFSYQNCTIVEKDKEIVGMMVAFPMYTPDTDDSLADQDADPVLAPYAKLEEYDSYYICGVALFPEFRGGGIGKTLMQLAEQKCAEIGLNKLSLIVFEQNTGAKRLYENLGYQVVASEEIVPHPLIHFTGQACLMVKKL